MVAAGYEETGLIWAEAGDELTWDIDAKTGDVTGGTLKVLLDDPESDAILLIHAPTAIVPSSEEETIVVA